MRVGVRTKIYRNNSNGARLMNRQETVRPGLACYFAASMHRPDFSEC